MLNVEQILLANNFLFYLCHISCPTNIFCYFWSRFLYQKHFCYFCHILCYFRYVFCLLAFLVTFVTFFTHDFPKKNNKNNKASFRTFDRCSRSANLKTTWQSTLPYSFGNRAIMFFEGPCLLFPGNYACANWSSRFSSEVLYISMIIAKA